MEKGHLLLGVRRRWGEQQIAPANSHGSLRDYGKNDPGKLHPLNCTERTLQCC